MVGCYGPKGAWKPWSERPAAAAVGAFAPEMQEEGNVRAGR